jgi:hypothetical protein
MAHEYYFNVNTDDDKGTPFGPVNKDNMDISRLIVDFSCWLDPSESITRIDHMMIKADPPQVAPPWRANYPLDETSSTVIPVDTYPLEYVDHSIIHGGKAVIVDMAAGTPGLTYAVSFSVTAGVSLRRRLVDILMVIDIPLNPDMVALSDGATPSYTYPLVVNTTTNLPYGFTGRVYVENTVETAITITLPPTPDLGDEIVIKDVLGNSAEFFITIVGDSAATIDRAASLVLRSPFAAATLEWSGSWWSQMA